MILKKFIILTTINSINEEIQKLKEYSDFELVIVGDLKTPNYDDDKITFLSVELQKKLGLKFFEICPYNSYQRKNIGYLYALKKNANLIYETDDDNYPLNNWNPDINFNPNTIREITYPTVCNVYNEYTEELIWPRGFPLNNIIKNEQTKYSTVNNPKIGIWQGLVNGEPDVDAIFRLTQGKQIEFKNNEPIILAKNVFCPFNSQNTFWTTEFFPYLYLPITVSMRFTDILRGYVAQRCLWEHDANLGFTGPTAFQKRNTHNIMKDFNDEINCYTQTNQVIQVLSEISLTKSPEENLTKIYQKFYDENIVSEKELTGLNYWFHDLNKII